MALGILATFCARLALVLLFLPFSALDKILNFEGAVDQAEQAAPSRAVAQALIFIGLLVEIVMSLCVLTGVVDRLAAFILAGYCGVTALLWKQFWKQPDFKLRGPSRGREVFWDCLKNFAVAGGFLAVAWGGTVGGFDAFLHDPFGSSHPYAASASRHE